MVNWLAAREGELPRPADHDRVRVGVERWRAAAAADVALAERVEAQLAEPGSLSLIEAIFGNSPYLTHLGEREPKLLAGLVEAGPEPAVAALWQDLAAIRRSAAAGEDPSRPLRLAKRRLALATAVADIAGAWSLAEVTAALSGFAEQALGAASAFLLTELARQLDVQLKDPEAPETGSGLIVLGMGKLGAGELNYSSDIDLIIFYDPECWPQDCRSDLQNRFVRLARGLVRIMAQRTADGYVFRTDLRLRPDPGSTPPAMSVLAAEIYYETLGQNWERAAMIKARPVAGDLAAGLRFVDQLRPFIWRKNLDFAAIRDIHSIKRQIYAHRGGGKIAVGGHNIKLGRGGIREIEFFIQTQQLIWGGRLPSLRLTGTCAALMALVQAGKLADPAARELISAYEFLRRVEHRLQMINDEQTHALPEDPAALAHVAAFLGFAGTGEFSAPLLHHLHRVEAHYAELFEDAPALTASELGGNLVFTGGEPDPETLATLARLGFAKPEMVDAAVRGWHHGRCRAMRSPRARELLTELMPFLLKGIAEAPDPDGAFVTFDRFLSGLPAGVQLFSMFHARPELLKLVVHVMGVAPGLATTLARRPSVLESVLAADFFREPPSVADLQIELDGVLSRARDLEEVLDLSRRWVAERNFQVGMLSLNRLIGTSEAQIAWSNVADAAVRALLPRVQAEFAKVHGQVAGCDLAVVAMGKLGSREMTVGSDLDLIFVYTTPAVEAASDGPRPLPASQYFARLSQRLINAITAPTAEGRLYEVDMRLRPSGKAGPIATSLASYQRYHREDSWTWEQMALTRARVIAGPSALTAEIDRSIRWALTQPRDQEKLRAEVADMRGKMERERRARSLWDVKHVRGGLVDIEFIAQYLQLGHAHAAPQVLSSNTMDALNALAAAGVLAPEAADELIEALGLWQQMQARLRLAFADPLAAGSEEGAKVVHEVFRDIAGPDVSALTRRMEATAAAVLGRFREIVGETESAGEAAADRAAG